MNTPAPDIPVGPDAPANPGTAADAPAVASHTGTSAGPVTAPALRRALIAGARRVIAARDGLNRINVFPVADGDTGNNLAFTLSSVLNGALSRRSRHIGEVLRRIGDDAIDGARGNSAAIPSCRALQWFIQGQIPQAGDRGVQMVAPRSITACA